MKRKLVILIRKLTLVLFFLTQSCLAQVSLSTNLIKTIPTGQPLSFEVRIKKTNIENFSRLQIEVPAGVLIQEMDSREGVFSLENNKVKIIWVNTPPEEEFLIRLKLFPPKQPGKRAFVFSFFYVQENVKKEWSSDKYEVRFTDTVLPPLMSAPMVRLTSKADAIEPPLAQASPVSTTGKTPEQLRLQVAQLRKDAKEARAVGEKEKRKVSQRLDSLDREEKTWARKPDGSLKKTELAEIQHRRKKAGEQLMVAERVLTLSETLNAQADEIEQINKRLNPSTYNDKEQNAGGKTVGGPLQNMEVDYRVQIGSFRERPSGSAFKGLGKVSSDEQHGTFRVFVGQFREKSDAYALRDRLQTKYPGSFVVRFEKGKRVH